MKTQNGNTYKSLFDVTVQSGVLSTKFNVPMTLPDVDGAYLDKLTEHVNDCIMREVRPGTTYQKCVNRIEHHRQQLRGAYIELIETYQRAITPKATLQTAADKARYAMFALMDDKMLRMYASNVIGEKASDFILPDEREQLVELVVQGMKERENGVAAKAE